MRITKSFLWPVLALVLCSAAPHAFARCYKVIGTQNNPGVTSSYIKPSEGVAASWAGACDTCNGNLGIPSVINLSSGDFIPPGTMLASSVAPFVQYGTTGGYDPERVFFAVHRKILFMKCIRRMVITITVVTQRGIRQGWHLALKLPMRQHGTIFCSGSLM